MLAFMLSVHAILPCYAVLRSIVLSHSGVMSVIRDFDIPPPRLGDISVRTYLT